MPFSEEDSTDGLLAPYAATKKAKIDFLPGHPADVLATCADIGKAERLPGGRPEMRIEEGVKRRSGI